MCQLSIIFGSPNEVFVHLKIFAFIALIAFLPVYEEEEKNLKSETCRFQLHWYHPTGVESSNEMGNGKWEMGNGNRNRKSQEMTV